MFLADFHLHSTFSDGKLAVPDLIDLYGSRGFGAIAITDHVCEEKTLIGKAAGILGHTLTPATFPIYRAILESEAARAWEQYRMVVLTGFELSKNSVLNHRSAHLLGIGVTDFIWADGDVLDLARAIRAQGALAIAAHPVSTRKLEKQTYHLWDRRSELEAEFDAWEVASGPHLFDEVAESRLPMIASSDLHVRRQLTSWKTVLDCERSPGAILEAIRRQKVSFRFYQEEEGEKEGEKMPTWIPWTAACLWALACITTWLGTWLALRHLRRSPPHLDAPFALYPVSILKPLKGADPGLVANLESFFALDYPEFELLFSVSDPLDPAAAVVRELIRRHPRARAKLMIGRGGTLGSDANPKVENMIDSYAQAAFDWLLISDSNVRVPRDYLRRMVAHLESGVGLVSNVVAGRGAGSRGAEIESVSLNGFCTRAMILCARIGRPCVIGKSMLFRRSTADRFGGIRNLSRYLAEDQMAGEAMRRLGLRVVTAVDPVVQHLGELSFHDYRSRHIRWGRLRKAQEPVAFALELLISGCLAPGILGAWAFGALGFADPAAFFWIHALSWFLADALLLERMDPEANPLKRSPAWLGRELLAPVIWLSVASGRKVLWRGRKLVIRRGGLLGFPTEV